MASSSSNKSCLHCMVSSSDSLRNGWDLCTGKYAQLCHRCYYIYEAGKFCETFHLNQPDWRECKFCDKPVHCGCLVSFNDWLLLEHGDAEAIICMECSKVSSFMAQYFSHVPDCAEEIKTFHIRRNPKFNVVYMFEKLLSVGDTSNKDGSIVIPKEYAQAYFPDVSDPQGIILSVLDDIDIKKWNLRLRFWHKMYVVDDLREYMKLHSLQGGDTLTFSRLIPNGPYIMGFRYASSKKPSS